MEADAHGLAGFGVCLAVACVFTGAVAFAQLGAGALGDDEAAIDEPMTPVAAAPASDPVLANDAAAAPAEVVPAR
jgi:hypothetical protein